MSRHTKLISVYAATVGAMANAAVRNAYIRAFEAWTGCDWHTEFGNSRLDLHGVRASHATLLAQATAGPEAADWRAARRWLEEVERDAAMARAEGGAALAMFDSGQLAAALNHARRACALESKYQPPSVWTPLCDAIEAVRQETGQT